MLKSSYETKTLLKQLHDPQAEPQTESSPNFSIKFSEI